MSDVPALFDGERFVEELPDIVLPFDPLTRWWGAELPAIASAVGVDVRTVQRWKQAGLSFAQADLLACRAGVNPCDVWGDVWWAGTVLNPDQPTTNTRKDDP